MPRTTELGSLWFNGRPVDTDFHYDFSADVNRDTLYFGDSIPGKALAWAQKDSIWVCTQTVFRNVPWDGLDAAGYIFGRPVIIDGVPYLCRSLKVGTDEESPDEWDGILDALGDNEDLWNCKHSYFWGQENYRKTKKHTVRGYISPRYYGIVTGRDPGAVVGFRPVLEPLPDNIRDIESHYGKGIVVYGQEMGVYGRLKEATDYDLVLEISPAFHTPGMQWPKERSWCHLEGKGQIAVIDREAPIWITIPGKFK